MVNFLIVLETGMKVKRPIDDQLIIDIANGSQQALHELYDSVSASVYGFVLSITKNSHDAEDVLQETFLTVYEKAVDYKPSGKPMAWIFTIAKNHALLKIRSNSRLRLLDDDKSQLGDSFNNIETLEQRLVIEASFKVLSDDERQILMLHALSGMKHREIAAVLEMPINTVLSKYHRAIKKMRTELSQEVAYEK